MKAVHAQAPKGVGCTASGPRGLVAQYEMVAKPWPRSHMAGRWNRVVPGSSSQSKAMAKGPLAGRLAQGRLAQ